MNKPVLAGSVIFVLALLLTSCGSSGGEVEIDSTQIAGTTASMASANAGMLTNDNWDVAVADADRYRGAAVDITGEIFNVLGNYDGASHYQMFTDPEGRQGNTHLAVALNGPKLSEDDFVHVVGTLEKMWVVNSRGGTELKLPYVTATSVEVLNGTSAQTPGSEPLPGVSPSPVVSPTSLVTDTPTSTATPSSATVIATPTLSVSTPTVAAPLTTTGPFKVELSTADLNAGPSMPWTNDASSPTGQYLSGRVSNRDWDGTPPIPANGSAASVDVAIQKAGRYAVWLRMQYENIDSNSVWLVVDNQRAVLFGNEDGGYGTWRWIGWRDGNPSARVNVDLVAGQHTFTIVSREAGTRFDRVLVSDDLSLRPADPPAPTPAPASPPVAPAAKSTPMQTAPASVPTATPSTQLRSSVSQTATATQPSTATPTAKATPTPEPTATPKASPTSAPSPTPTKAAVQAQPPAGSYTVQSGDTLSAIAQRLYGDASLYNRIYEANRDKLTSPDRISPGTQLRIPR